MSKRVATVVLASKPAKLVKVSNVWSTIPDDEEKKEFKPVEGGPKTKVPKSFVLNYNPKMTATITLNGCYPEVRFASYDGCFFMTGEEFLNMAGKSTKILDLVRLEATEEGFRLARYSPTESGMPDLMPISVLDMNKYAAKRLKSKLEDMCDHVCELRESEDVIRLMFDCVAEAYREEYRLSNTLIPITEQFTELSRIVDTYVPAVSIVKAFLEQMYENKFLAHFNHYNLCSIVSAQKPFLQTLLIQ